MRKTILFAAFFGAFTLASLTGWPGRWLFPASLAAEDRAAGGPSAQLELEQAFADTADRLSPSVVSIITRSSGRRFRRGLGSGIIIDTRGHVMTNNHVVKGGDRWTVKLADGTQTPAQLVGTDPKSDIAVLRIATKGVIAARLGDSSKVRVGQWVLAMGTPHDLPRTVTAGIISAKGRSGLELARYENYLQTDAAINQGNSGGPLVNLRGEVVGVTIAILSPRTGSQGISFAIPVNMAKKVAHQLIEKGRVARGWLGVYMENLSRTWVRRLDFDGRPGVVVTEVVRDSPAEQAGLQAGDVVLAMDGRHFSSDERLMLRIADHAPGDRITLDVWRDGSQKKLVVVLGDLDAAEPKQPE